MSRVSALAVDRAVAAIFAVPATAVLVNEADRAWSIALIPLVVALVVGGMAARRSWPVACVSMELLAVVVLDVFEPRAVVVALCGLAYVLYAIAVCAPLGVAGAGLVASLAVAWSTAWPDFAHLGGAVGFSVAYGVVWAVGVGVAMNRRYTASLLAQQAERSASELEHARAMTVEQRLRISRELHDMVAHGISTIAVQAAYGGLVAEREPTKARDALAAIESVSRQTLTEMRQLLRVLRDDDSGLGDDDHGKLAPTPTLADINRLVAGAAESGLRLDVIIDGPLAALPAGVETAAYRTIQEAVTNAVKHAGAQVVRALLHCADSRLTVEVTDDGRGCSGEPVLGFGLVGMRERALLFGGTFWAENAPARGFRVTCTFRLDQAYEGVVPSLLAGTVS